MVPKTCYGVEIEFQNHYSLYIHKFSCESDLKEWVEHSPVNRKKITIKNLDDLYRFHFILYY